MPSKEEVEDILKDISNEFREFKGCDNYLYPLDLKQFYTIKDYVEQIEEDKIDLQKSVEQIFDDYQDIGKKAFEYSDKIEKLKTEKKKLIKKLKEKDKIIDLMAEEIDTSDYCVPEDCPGIDCKDHVKEYYRKMARRLKQTTIS